MKSIFKAFLFVALAALIWLPPAAQAAMSGWADSEGGRMRLVAISQPRNGAILALLQIEPKPGWKTYWRDPGDAGMPPQLDFTGSTNLVLRWIDFPVPEIGMDDGGRFVGYHRPVSLIVEFAKPLPDAPSTINLNAIVGICEKVCLPFMASFSVPLTPGQPEGEEFMQVQLAQSALPEKPGKDFVIRNLHLSPDSSAIKAEVTVPNAEAPQVAIMAPRGLRIGKMEIDTGTDRVAHIRIPVIGGDKAHVDGTITVLVKSGGRAIEATLALK
ncbi:MAG: cytochrome biosis protein [Rhizobium sp.]|nr:cytochrome biosis protein [Rhizobium sp.]